MQIVEALRLQMDVQHRLYEQLEVFFFFLILLDCLIWYLWGLNQIFRLGSIVFHFWFCLEPEEAADED